MYSPSVGPSVSLCRRSLSIQPSVGPLLCGPMTPRVGVILDGPYSLVHSLHNYEESTDVTRHLNDDPRRLNAPTKRADSTLRVYATSMSVRGRSDDDDDDDDDDDAMDGYAKRRVLCTPRRECATATTTATTTAREDG